MTSLTPEALRSLCERLRGEYRIPITDGHGPAGGEEPNNPGEFVRTFETPPIQHQAAAAIAGLVVQISDERRLRKIFARDAAKEMARANQGDAKLRAIAAYCTDPLPDTAVTHKSVAQEQAAKIYRIGQFANGEIAAIASPDAGEKT